MNATSMASPAGIAQLPGSHWNATAIRHAKAINQTVAEIST